MLSAPIAWIGSLGRLDLRRLLLRADMTGKIDLHGRAFADLAVNPNMPGRLAHEAVDLAQAETGALADAFGREERLECALQGGGVHAAAGVGDRDHDVLTDLDRLGHVGHIGLVEMTVGGLDRHLAAARHGVAGVDRQIDQRIFQLVGVHMGAPQAARQHGFQRYGFTERPAQQLAGCGNQLVGVDGFRVERLLPCEGEQPAGELGGAPHAFDAKVLAAGDARHRRRAVQGGELAPDHVEPALHDGEQIVEIVGDAAGELADRLHLLRLAQRLLRLLAGLVLGFQLARALVHPFFQGLGEGAQLREARLRSVTSTLTPTTRTARPSAS